jgi:hypothetical protein
MNKMTHREVDFNVLGQNCERRLAELEALRVEEEETRIRGQMERKWFPARTREQAIEQLRNKSSRYFLPDWPVLPHKDVNRIKEVLALSKVPGSLNRIVNLSAEDAYIIFKQGL